MSKIINIWGDSISWGYGDTELGGWVNRLNLYLAKNNREDEVYNLGISGEITTEILQRFDIEAQARKPQQIIFAIGINDSQYLIKENEIRVPLDIFIKNIKELINKARKFSSDIAFICLTPVDEDKTNPIPWNKNKNYTNNSIEKYSEELKDICQQEKLKYIDIYKVFKEQKNYKELLYDGLHPNAKGHQLIFETVKKDLNL